MTNQFSSLDCARRPYLRSSTGPAVDLKCYVSKQKPHADCLSEFCDTYTGGLQLGHHLPV
jgi:hypothetical protein